MGTFGPRKWYLALQAAKQILSGLFISPTERIELIYLSGTGEPLEFDYMYSNFLWNFGDSFLFIPLEGENTFGLFKFFGAAAMNQPWMELKP